MTFNELPYAEACLEMLRTEDRKTGRRGKDTACSGIASRHPIDSIDFSNSLSDFLETTLSYAFLAAYRQGGGKLELVAGKHASMIPRPEIVLYSQESSSRPNPSKI
jgi:hypothetical protein